MGCFLACFCGGKHRKHHRRPTNKALASHLLIQESCKTLQHHHHQQQQQQRISSPKQPTPKVTDVQFRENTVQESHGGIKKKVTFNLDVKTYEEAPATQFEEDEEKDAVKDKGEPQNQDHKSSPSLVYPLNHRYQDCSSSDDEGCTDGEEGDYVDCDFDEEDDFGTDGKEESYESFFSLPIEKEKERKSFKEVNSPIPINDREEVFPSKASVRDRSQYVHSVLNPVENLSQWKDLKDRKAPLKYTMKENVDCKLETKAVVFSPEPTFNSKKSSNPSTNHHTKQKISVDCSLSNWLVSPESSTMEGPQQSNSVRSTSPLSREERPILGALTVDDLKQASVSSSPRRSPSRSPDEIPIVGTVGSYWSSVNNIDDSASSRKTVSDTRGIPNTTSKYREDKRVNWNSTPFDLRLERAMNKGVNPEAPPSSSPPVF